MKPIALPGPPYPSVDATHRIFCSPKNNETQRAKTGAVLYDGQTPGLPLAPLPLARPVFSFVVCLTESVLNTFYTPPHPT